MKKPTQGQCMTYKFDLFHLPYSFDSLEPYIDTKTMEIHHNRHLKAYTDKLNAALAPYPEFHNWTLERLLCNVNNLPVKLRNNIRNNGGGVITIFTILCQCSRRLHCSQRAAELLKEN